MDPVALTRALVDIDSTTGLEAEAGRWLVDYLRGLGYSVTTSDGTAAGQQAVVTQDHDKLVAEIGNKPLPFVQIKRDAFIVVVGEAIRELHRPLIERQQTFRLAGDGDAGNGVCMKHAHGIVARRVDGAVDCKACRIDAESERIVDDVAVEINCHEVGCGDFLEAHAIGVDQETVVTSRKPHRNVSVDAVVEAEPVNEPIGSGEVDSNLLGAVVVSRRTGMRS